MSFLVTLLAVAMVAAGYFMIVWRGSVVIGASLAVAGVLVGVGVPSLLEN